MEVCIVVFLKLRRLMEAWDAKHGDGDDGKDDSDIHCGDDYGGLRG